MDAKPKRVHFGSGSLALDPTTSVFLNCPYDPKFQPLFDAAVLATVCCGFVPRSALESGTVAEPRMERITRALFGSQYSIHDLSRCQGEGDANLARFNMPLELGIAMARRYLVEGAAQKHDWLVLVPTGHEYGRFLSDLTGFDPEVHDGSAPSFIAAITKWLATRRDAVSTLSPKQIIKGLPGFKREMKLLRKNWGQAPPWVDVVLAASGVARRLGK